MATNTFEAFLAWKVYANMAETPAEQRRAIETVRLTSVRAATRRRFRKRTK